MYMALETLFHSIYLSWLVPWSLQCGGIANYGASDKNESVQEYRAERLVVARCLAWLMGIVWAYLCTVST